MSRRPWSLVAALLLPFPLLAAEGGEHAGAQLFLGQPLWIWQLVNLVLFVFLLVWFLRKPVAVFFGDRQKEVAETIRKADENRRRAEELAARMEERLAKLEGELAAIHEHARQEAAAEQAKLLRQAEGEADKLLQRARNDMDTRVRHARKELTAYAGDLAVEMARDLLAKNVTPDDESRLLHDGLEALAASDSKTPPRAS